MPISPDFATSYLLSVTEIARDPEATKTYREKVAQNPNPTKKFIHTLALCAIKCLGPDTISSVLLHPYHARNMEVLGTGFHSTAVRIRTAEGDTDLVCKIDRASAKLTEEQRHKKLKQLKEESQILQKYLPDIALRQDFIVSSNPLSSSPESQVITGIQDFVEYRPLSSNDYTNKKIAPQLHDFLAASDRMIEATGYAPDVNGANNFGVRIDDEQLVLVDTGLVNKDTALETFTECKQKLTAIGKQLTSSIEA